MPTENQEDNFLKLAMNYLSYKSKYPIIGEIKYILGIWIFFSTIHEEIKLLKTDEDKAQKIKKRNETTHYKHSINSELR